MQQQDNLASSVSLFYAEVQRLRLLLEAADRAAACALLLIDEMLRGTNARERTAASRIILERLLRSGASCILATHDLDLAAEAASRTQFYSCHFEETIKDGRMSFDYLLRPGPVASGNALRILELEGVLP